MSREAARRRAAVRMTTARRAEIVVAPPSAPVAAWLATTILAGLPNPLKLLRASRRICRLGELAVVLPVYFIQGLLAAPLKLLRVLALNMFANKVFGHEHLGATRNATSVPGRWRW